MVVTISPSLSRCSPWTVLQTLPHLISDYSLAIPLSIPNWPPRHLPFTSLLHYHLPAWPLIPHSYLRPLTHLCLPSSFPLSCTILRLALLWQAFLRPFLYLIIALYAYQALGLIFCTNTKLLRLKSLTTDIWSIPLLVNHRSSGWLPDLSRFQGTVAWSELPKF